jgi:hypothetical protein
MNNKKAAHNGQPFILRQSIKIILLKIERVAGMFLLLNDFI